MTVIPADKIMIRLKSNDVFRAVIPGYFVPDARMIEISEQLNRLELINKTTK